MLTMYPDQTMDRGDSFSTRLVLIPWYCQQRTALRLTVAWCCFRIGRGTHLDQLLRVHREIELRVREAVDTFLRAFKARRDRAQASRKSRSDRVNPNPKDATNVR